MITLFAEPRASPAVSNSSANNSLSTADTPGGRVRDYVSFSALSLFQRCSLRYHFRYVAQLPEESIAASLVFGRAIHRAIEYHFKELLAGNAPPDLDVLLAEFDSGWDETPAEQIAFPKTASRKDLTQLATRMLAAFRDSDVSQPRGHILGIEEELRGRVIKDAPDLLARLDLLREVDGTLIVSDFKTSRSAWSDENAADAAGQLQLYSLLVSQRFPGLKIRLEFVVLSKAKKVVITRHDIAFDAAQIERTKRIAQRVWQAIKAGSYFPSPSPLNCGTCPYQTACRNWAG